MTVDIEALAAQIASLGECDQAGSSTDTAAAVLMEHAALIAAALRAASTAARLLGDGNRPDFICCRSMHESSQTIGIRRIVHDKNPPCIYTSLDKFRAAMDA